MIQTLQHGNDGNNNRNEKAVRCLSDLGFGLDSIRQALPKLCGISCQNVAERLGVTRQAVALTLSGKRAGIALQSGIASIFEIPVSIIFPVRLIRKVIDDEQSA